MSLRRITALPIFNALQCTSPKIGVQTSSPVSCRTTVARTLSSVTNREPAGTLRSHARLRHHSPRSLRAILNRKADIKELWFYTPKPVRTVKSDPWREALKDKFGVELTVFSREEIISALLEPRFQYLLPLHLGLATPFGVAVKALDARLRSLCKQRSEM